MDFNIYCCLSKADFNLSKSSTHRQRVAMREEVYSRIRSEWLNRKPKFPVVHWDTKLIKHLSGKSGERVAVLVSGGVHLPSPKYKS